MKRILLLVPRLNIGGAETYVASLAVKLKEKGFQVFLASGGGILAQKLKKQGFQHFFLPIRLSTKISAYFLARIVKKYKIDLIHANSAAAGITSVIVKQKYCSIPVIYTAHGIFGQNEKEMQLNMCDKIICVSHFVREDAIKKGFTPEKLVTIYSGIDLERFKPHSERRIPLRKKYKIPQEAFVLAIVARIKNLSNKGHQDLLDILRQYPGAANWHLMVIGTGKGIWNLKFLLWKYHLRDRVHCLGHVVDVENVLDAADVVVLPSRFETFGLVLAEAMAMEKPVVAYAVGGTPELVRDGETGFLAELFNIRDLYSKIMLLKKNKYSGKSRRWVKKSLNSEVMIRKLCRIITSLYST